MSQTLDPRDPTHRDKFLALASALQRLGGVTDETADAIQAAMNDDDFNFERSAQTIGVPLDDLVAAYCDAMLERGFYLRRIRVQ
jgi:hypothetical protein